MILQFIFLSILLVYAVLSASVHTNETKSDVEIDFSESFQDTVKKQILPPDEKSSVKKENSGCKSNNCTREAQNSTSTTSRVYIQRIKAVKSPPKSFNFLASAPTIAKMKNKTDHISIYQINEKGDIRDWPLEYDNEGIHKDYKIDGDREQEEDEDFEEEYSNSRPTSEVSVVSLLPNDDDDEEFENEIEPLTTSTQPEKETHSIETGTTRTTSVFRKEKSKEELLNKGSNYKNSAPKVSRLKGTPQLLSSKKGSNLTNNLKITSGRNSMTNESSFPFGFIPNLNKSYRFFPYPVYFSAKPMIYKKKLVVPYPYFIVDPDQLNPENFVNVSDLTGTNISSEIWIEGLLNPEGEGKEFKNVDIDFDDNYGEMENDEDYIPSTKGDEEPTFPTPTKSTSELTTSSKNVTSITPSTITKPFSTSVKTTVTDSTRTTTSFVIYIDTTTTHTTKYPDPYKNGSIYSYYDCAEIINSGINPNQIHPSGLRGVLTLTSLIVFHL